MPPPPPPPIHTRRCALAQPPRRSWPPRRWDQLLVRCGSRAAACGRLVSKTWAARLCVRPSAASLRVIGRAEALARHGRGHVREHLHGTQAGTPTRCLRLPAGATCTSTWTVAALAQCRVEYCLPRRRGGGGRAVRAHFSIPNPNSRFSFRSGLAV